MIKLLAKSKLSVNGFEFRPILRDCKLCQGTGDKCDGCGESGKVEFVGIVVACRILKISIEQTYRLVKEGKLAARKVKGEKNDGSQGGIHGVHWEIPLTALTTRLKNNKLLTCEKCGYEWKPRGGNPNKICPKCLKLQDVQVEIPEIVDNLIEKGEVNENGNGNSGCEGVEDSSGEGIGIVVENATNEEAAKVV